MFSRVYLGVHSPADIVSGGILGCLLLSAFLQIDDAVSATVSLFDDNKCIFCLARFLHIHSRNSTSVMLSSPSSHFMFNLSIN